jgi:predicted short-subunit dehydrogenase-like oxidoreductase (DUF2520 family)
MRTRAYGIIGMGRLGLALAESLEKAGATVSGLASRSEASRATALERFPHLHVGDPAEVAGEATCVILAVPDDSIQPVVQHLTEVEALSEGQYVMHVSGCHGLAPLQPGTDKGAIPFAVHPAMTFAGTAQDAARLAGTPFGVTTLDTHRAEAEEFVGLLGGIPAWIPDDKRTLYHSALVFGSNYLVSLISGAQQILSEAGVDDPGEFAAPLFRAALENTILNQDAALTGPVRRGDIGTVRAHVSALDKSASGLTESYIDFAEYTARRALERNLNEERRLESMLDEIARLRASTTRPLGEP